MIPIPNEERSIRQKRFRGPPRDVHPDRAESYLHRDAARRETEISTFVNSPTNMVYRGLSKLPPVLNENHTSLRYIPAPQHTEHPVGRRNPHRVAPFEAPERIFPPGGLVERPERVRAATSMEAYPVGHHIHAHVSGERPSPPGKRIFPEAMARSTKGDMSLARNGVKRVDLAVRNERDDAVTGFRSMGRFSTEDRPTGKKLVTAEPYDPVRIFQTYGRRHPVVLPVTSNY
jgi:hypothetical protein